MLSGVRDSFVYCYDSSTGKIRVKENIQISHLTPVSNHYQVMLK